MASKVSECAEANLFSTVEFSINSTFQSLIHKLTERRDKLLVELYDIKMNYFNKEETRKKHLNDLDQLIKQMEDICIEQNKIAKLQEEHIANTKKERDQYRTPTSLPLPFFNTANLVQLQQQISTFGELKDATTHYSTRLEPFRSIGEKCAFNRPYGVAIDGKGNMYVVDSRNNKVQVIHVDGHLITEYGKGEIKSPHGIALYEDFLFVSVEKCVYKYSILSPGNSVCKSEVALNDSQGMCVDENEVFVADCSNNRIVVFNLDLKFIRNLGEGNLFEPGDVKINFDKVFVADNSEENSIHIFSKSGDLLNNMIYMKDGTQSSKFLCFDKFNNIIISDCLGRMIQVHTSDGEFVHRIQCGFRPTGIAVNQDNIICIDSDYHLIHFY